MNLNQYEEDQVKQEKGSPCYLGDDGCFYVKRIHTPEYNKQIAEITRELYGFDSKNMDNNLIVAHWLCEYGVTGWNNILNPDETELEYSKSNARQVFLNPNMFLSLNLLLITHAGNYANYLHDEVIEDVEAVKKS